MLTQLPAVFALLLICLVGIAGFTDFRTRRIPNWLCATGVLLGLSLHTFLFGWSGLQHSASGMLLGFGIYLGLYMVRAMGAGDVKLMAAVGAFAGPSNWLSIFLITALVGGCVGLTVILIRKRVFRTFSNIGFIMGEMRHMRPAYVGREELGVNGRGAVTLPHGIAIALGSFVFLFLSTRGMI